VSRSRSGKSREPLTPFLAGPECVGRKVSEIVGPDDLGLTVGGRVDYLPLLEMVGAVAARRGPGAVAWRGCPARAALLPGLLRWQHRYDLTS